MNPTPGAGDDAAWNDRTVMETAVCGSAGQSFFLRRFTGLRARQASGHAPARARAVDEIRRSLRRDVPPSVAPLLRATVDGDEALLLYASYEGSLDALLDTPRRQARSRLPLPVLFTLRAVLDACACLVIYQEHLGDRLVSPRLSTRDIVTAAGEGKLRMSSLCDADRARAEAGSTAAPSSPGPEVASLSAIILECVTGLPPGAKSPPLSRLRPGLPPSLTALIDELHGASPGDPSWAEACHRLRSEALQLTGQPFPKAADAFRRPADFVSWQLGLLPALVALDATEHVDEYFSANAGSFHARLPVFQYALSRWRARRTLPEAAKRAGGTAAELPLWGDGMRRVSAERREEAALLLAQSRVAMGRGRLDAARATWGSAAVLAPLDPKVWLTLASIGERTRARDLEALGYAEAICCARGDLEVLRRICGRLGGATTGELAAYLDHSGHGPVAEGLRPSARATSLR